MRLVSEKICPKRNLPVYIRHYDSSTVDTINRTFLVCCICPSPGPAASNTSAAQHCLYSQATSTILMPRLTTTLSQMVEGGFVFL